MPYTAFVFLGMHQEIREKRKKKNDTSGKKKRRKRKKDTKGKVALPLSKTLDYIAGIFEKKVKADAIDDKNGNNRDTLPEFVADFFEHMFGIPSLANKKKSELRNGVKKYMDTNLRARWFGTMVNWVSKYIFWPWNLSVLTLFL